ncbi:MAG: DUF3822 family protein [Bacteroidales bacterium]|nr:DUF3822 family protein [Bacteroidales bacterium]
MHELSLIDNTFQKEEAGKYHLSIQSDLNGFAYCIYDNAQKKHVVFRKYNLQTDRLIDNFLKSLEEVFRTDDLLKLTYSTSAFMFLTQKSTLIPDAYFSKDILKSYLEFNHTLDDLDEIHYNYLPAVDAYNVFAMHTYVAAEISKHINGVIFYHQAYPFIEKTLEFSGNKQKQIIAVNLNHYFFDIAVCAAGKLKLYNTFQYTGPTDLLYYILFICKQFLIEPRQLELLLSGELSDTMTFREKLKEYIPDTQTLKTDPVSLADGLSKIKESNYSSLFNLVHCE